MCWAHQSVTEFCSQFSVKLIQFVPYQVMRRKPSRLKCRRMKLTEIEFVSGESVLSEQISSDHALDDVRVGGLDGVQ